MSNAPGGQPFRVSEEVRRDAERVQRMRISERGNAANQPFATSVIQAPSSQQARNTQSTAYQSRQLGIAPTGRTASAAQMPGARTDQAAAEARQEILADANRTAGLLRIERSRREEARLRKGGGSPHLARERDMERAANKKASRSLRLQQTVAPVPLGAGTRQAAAASALRQGEPSSGRHHSSVPVNASSVHTSYGLPGPYNAPPSRTGHSPGSNNS